MPAVLLKSALSPFAIFKLPPVLLKSALKTNRGVAFGGVVYKGIVTQDGVFVR